MERTTGTRPQRARHTRTIKTMTDLDTPQPLDPQDIVKWLKALCRAMKPS
ncbi:hypothetical protein C4K20_0252 [Pseudomonas chlororaphis subsp. aurantiaca]|nr:hypothetical protein C4K20_0252 [Pseudomonas chlororaphis subsp. aurantiaca]AZD70646.1 hypothetical protein C4K16_0255 [Pseudomonas chlororaphis subsp. aurantiaca]